MGPEWGEIPGVAPGKVSNPRHVSFFFFNRVASPWLPATQENGSTENQKIRSGRLIRFGPGNGLGSFRCPSRLESSKPVDVHAEKHTYSALLFDFCLLGKEKKEIGPHSSLT